MNGKKDSKINLEYPGNSGKQQGGHTIIELIAILLIIVIIVAVAVSRYTSTSHYDVASEAEILKANIRYAQYRAMSDADTTYGVNNATWGILFSPNSYTLQKSEDGNNTTTTNFLGENSPTHNLPSGISLSTGSGSTITFNVWGVPITGNANITITDGGASSQTITVTENTGFIP